MLLIVLATLLSMVLDVTTAVLNSSTSSAFVDDEIVSKVLSRRKRFLIFPDGSSVQLVFCTQNHGYLQIGNIVWFGTTAALAWELPTDPEVFDMFRDRNKLYESNRRSDVIYYLDEEGRVIDKREYKRRIMINPAFAKRSVNTIEKKDKIITKVTIKKMHDTHKNKNLIEELDSSKIDFDRKVRHELYEKLEKFLEAFGWDGNECILKMLCQTAKIKGTPQGTLMEEILKAVFTLPKVHVQSEVHNEYDDAHETNGDCEHLYPNCAHTTII